MRTSETVEISDLSHSILCCSDDTYCAHPRTCGIWNFGGGEIVVGHRHAECDYDKETQYHHTRCVAYKQRAKVLLQRSTLSILYRIVPAGTTTSTSSP